MTHLPARCKAVLETTNFGASIAKNSDLKIKAGSSTLAVYQALQATAHTITQLAVHDTATFTVLDFLQLHNADAYPEKFTPLVWSTVDACLAELTDSALFVVGNTKATLSNVLALAQLHDKTNQYDLVHRLWNHAFAQGASLRI